MIQWSASPACTELESIVLDWAARLLGLDSAFYNSSRSGGGAIQSTASDSALIAVIAARALYIHNHPGTPLEDLVLYTTTQTHSLGAKAALILGLSVRAIAVDPVDAFALRGSALRAALEEDASAGKKPFVLSQSISLLYRRKFYCEIKSRPSAQHPLARLITCMRSAK